MNPEVKEYKDVLDLAGGMTQSAVKAFADGRQWTDVVPIVSENLSKALEAVHGAEKITDAWKDHTKECVKLTTSFVIDQVFDVLNYKNSGTSTFPETSDILNAVEALSTGIVIKSLDEDGFEAQEAISVVLENMEPLVKSVDGITKVDDEFRADMRGFLHNVTQRCIDIAFDLKMRLEAKG